MMTMKTISIDIEADTDRMDNLGDALCGILDAVLDTYPTVGDYRIVGYTVGDGREAKFLTVVSRYGNSLAINLTKHAEEIGIDKGDRVMVTVRRDL